MSPFSISFSFFCLTHGMKRARSPLHSAILAATSCTSLLFFTRLSAPLYTSLRCLSPRHDEQKRIATHTHKKRENNGEKDRPRNRARTKEAYSRGRWTGSFHTGPQKGRFHRTLATESAHQHPPLPFRRRRIQSSQKEGSPRMNSDVLLTRKATHL